MALRSNVLFIGIGGQVVAVNKDTGEEVWRQKLKANSLAGTFVTLVEADDVLYAGTAGEAFCLDRNTGEIRWHNKLKGLGQGFVTFGSMTAVAIAAIAAAAQAAHAAANTVIIASS